MSEAEKTTPKLVFDRVSKVYRRTHDSSLDFAVKDVSLTIQEAHFVSFLGSSGCGKSTLLNIAAGFVAPSSGEVRYGGKPVTGPGVDRGVVFQEYALFPWLTALDNVALGLRAKGVAKSERRGAAEHYLKVVGLSEHIHKYPRQLSGGMKQRAAIARTLANQPAMILMDEPFSALDSHTREALQDQLLEIWESTKTTIIFVTHSINEAVYLSDTIVMFAARPGRISRVVPNTSPYPRTRNSNEVVALERELREFNYMNEVDP